MAYTSGEYITKFIVPALIHTLRNLKQDFLAVIPNTPQRAIGNTGIVIHKIGQPIQVDWDKSDAYEDGDLVQFMVENDTVPWQYFSTTPFTTDSEEIRTSALNRGGILVQKSQEAIVESWVAKSIWTLAPDLADDQTANPIMETTGPDRGDGTGSKRLLIADMIRAAEKYNKMNLLQRMALYMILCPEHLTDLALDALNYQAFKDIYIKTKDGEPIDNHGWKFFWNNYAPLYDGVTNEKKALGAAQLTTDSVASTIFYGPHTTKSIRNVKRHFVAIEDDTRNNPPRDELRFTGNAIVAKTYRYGFGAIKQGKV